MRLYVDIVESDDGRVTVTVDHNLTTTVDVDDALVQNLYDAIDAFWNE